MNTGFKDHFSNHALDYARYRPDYPDALYEFLARTARQHELAWDCGTGNGQAAVALAEHFEDVFATDASEKQIAEAEPHPRVTYAIAPAEECPRPELSVDLVTVAQAIHWFDFDRFYATVRRVCRGGGVLAVWGYAFHRVNRAVDAVLMHLENDYVGPYWPPERRYPEERYTPLPFPFPEEPAPAFTMTARWTLAETLGYLNTWSATKRFAQERRFNPVELLTDQFTAAWGEPAERRTVTWDLFMRIGRVT